MRRFRLAVPAAFLAMLALPSLAEWIVGGRDPDEEKRTTFYVRVGQFTEIEGGVEETTRRLFTVTGQDDKQAGAESYSFEELGLEESEITYGASLEHMWKYVTLRLDGSYIPAEASGVADRDFYIGVDEVDFNGQSYDYMVIPEGRRFDATLDAAMIALRGQITPITVNPGGFIQFVPWLHLGIFVIAGEFDVDAGPATGVTQYENPPRDYVVGGHGTGDASVYAPEIGAGGEFKVRLGERRGQPIHLVLQGTYAIFEFKGTSDQLGVRSRNDKDLDVDYDAVEGRALLEIPMSEGVDLIAGVEYKYISADADSEAKDRPLEETLTRREKFDKHIETDLTYVNAIAGIRW